MTEPIKTVEELVAWTKELQGGMILYRGLASADWEVESSGYRRISKSEAIPSETLPAIMFQNYIYNLLDEASLQGFREWQGRNLTDLELLAELQHYGAATCLIDFTSSALIALWFACQDEEGQLGKVLGMATNSVVRFSTIRYEDLGRPIREFLNQGKLWKWEPSGLNNRIVGQQSVLVFGEGKIEESNYEEITVAANCKKDILATLEKSFGIRGQKLFNDLAGFALQNAHDQPYDNFSARDLLSLGVSFHQRGEYLEAKAHYSRAIELDPQDAYAYNNRGAARNAAGDHRGAITDFDIAIERSSEFAHAYNNRGVARSDLGRPSGGYRGLQNGC